LASCILLQSFQCELAKKIKESDGSLSLHLVDLVSQSLKNAFAKTGSQIRANFCDRLVGSTATVMVLFRSPSNGRWQSICGWLGNSRAVVLNSNGQDMRPITQNHCLDHSRESERVKEVAAIDKTRHRPGMRKTVVLRELSSQPSWILNEVSGVSTILTRAFEGGLVSPAVTDVPEIVCNDFSEGSRIIMASNSVWQSTSFNELAELKHRNPHEVAVFLCLVDPAKNLTSGLCRRPKRSDTTAIIIDIGDPAHVSSM
jgi:serine/threonine protein phosphatase PrpC